MKPSLFLLLGLLFAATNGLSQTEVPPPPDRGEANRDFHFPGGSPSSFLSAVQNHYAPHQTLDWLSIADIPPGMEAVHVPQLRLTAADESAFVNESRKATPDAQMRHPRLEALIALYNRVAREKPELGKLVILGDLAHPSAVLLVSNPASIAPQEMTIKAFPVGKLSSSKLAELLTVIDLSRLDGGAQRNDGVVPRRLDGQCRVHDKAHLLVCSGTPAYVEMVESITTAFQASSQGL